MQKIETLLLSIIIYKKLALAHSYESYAMVQPKQQSVRPPAPALLSYI